MAASQRIEEELQFYCYSQLIDDKDCAIVLQFNLIYIFKLQYVVKSFHSLTNFKDKG